MHILHICVIISLALITEQSSPLLHTIQIKNGKSSKDEIFHNGEDLTHFISNSLNLNITAKIIKSLEGRKIIAAQGIPYSDGAPGIFERGSLARQRLVLEQHDGTYIREKCYQPAYLIVDDVAAPSGSNDCLYLNVYMPKCDGLQCKDFPVMVYFHGGGFIGGDSSFYMPTRLLDEDVILVTVHYRLGVYSFFTTNDDNAGGNLALYDQTLALEWVKEYINDFKGDPEKVTIFGQSAGGVSVNYHMISQYREKNDDLKRNPLFHSAISDSGSVLDIFAYDENPLYSSFVVSKFVTNCDRYNLEEVYEADIFNPTEKNIFDLQTCMKYGDKNELAVAAYKLKREDINNGLPGVRMTAPGIQGEYVSNAILTKSPLQHLADDDIFNVPYMIGTMAQEGSYIFGNYYNNYLAPEELINNNTLYYQELLVPDIISRFGINDNNGVISEAMKKQYLLKSDYSNFASIAPGMIDMAGAIYFKAGAQQVAKMSSWNKKNKTSIYVYNFQHQGEATIFHYLFWGAQYKPPFDSGITHGDDLMYLFSLPSQLNQNDQSFIQRMRTLWINFATYGDPTPQKENNWKNLGISEWLPYEVKSESYMLISSDFGQKESLTTGWTITADQKLGPPYTQNCTEACDEWKQQVEDLEDERDSYEAAMIAFIILFIIAAILAGFFFYKWRHYK